MTSDLSLREWLTLLAARLRSALSSNPPTKTEPSKGNNPNPEAPGQATEQPITATPREDVPHVLILSPYKPRVEQRLQALAEASHRVTRAKSIRAEKIAQRNQEISTLAALCRIFQLNVESMPSYREIAESHGSFYQLREAGTLPARNTSPKWIVVAQDLIKGDELAVAEGFEPAPGPGKAKLEECLLKAEAALDAAKVADSDFQLEQKNLRDERDNCRAFAREISLFLRFTYHKIPPAQLRRFMRRMGYSYVNEAGEVEEEFDTSESQTENEESAVEVQSTEGPVQAEPLTI
jgi:hypothetical protein